MVRTLITPITAAQIADQERIFSALPEIERRAITEEVKRYISFTSMQNQNKGIMYNNGYAIREFSFNISDVITRKNGLTSSGRDIRKKPVDVDDFFAAIRHEFGFYREFMNGVKGSIVFYTSQERGNAPVKQHNAASENARRYIQMQFRIAAEQVAAQKGIQLYLR